MAFSFSFVVFDCVYWYNRFQMGFNGGRRRKATFLKIWLWETGLICLRYGIIFDLVDIVAFALAKLLNLSQWHSFFEKMACAHGCRFPLEGRYQTFSKALFINLSKNDIIRYFPHSHPCFIVILYFCMPRRGLCMTQSFPILSQWAKESSKFDIDNVCQL